MRRSVDRLRRDERGLSMIELVAALSILSTVLLVLYSVIQLGFNSYHKIVIENSLRDEGDLLMSSVMAELYELGPTSVSSYGGELVLEREKIAHRIAIRDGALYIEKSLDGAGGGGAIDTVSKVLPESSISVSCQSGVTQCGSGLIKIKLALAQEYGNKEQTLRLESQFGF